MRTLPSRFILPTLVFLIGCVVSGIVSWLFFMSLEDQLSIKFQNDTDQVVSLVQGRMNLYTNVLYGLEGLFGASDDVTETEWKRYADELHLTQNYRGISSMLYIERVSADEVADYPHAIFPASDKQDYYPITYIYQAIPTNSTSSLGFDVSSEERRAHAIMQAARTGMPTASAVVLSVNTRIPVFSIYAPLYAVDGASLDEAEKTETVQGFVTSTFRVKELFEGLAADPVFNRYIDAKIYDATTLAEASSSTLLFDTGEYRSEGSIERSDLMRTVTIPVAGRTWTLRFAAESGYSLGLLPNMLPWIVLLGGIGLSALLFLAIYALTSARARALIIATKMTADLQEAKAKDEAILSSIGDGVAVADMQGNLTYWNKAAEHILGMNFSGTQEAAWTETYGVFYPDEKTPMPGAEQALAKALKGENIASMAEFIRNAGVPLGRHISVTAQPIRTEEGAIFGGVAVFRDVSKEHEVDRAKTEFVSLASHQLRTPLTSIKWYTELLLEDAGALDAEQKEYAEEIKEASSRMNTLVAALLDVSRLDLGTFIIEPVPGSLIEVMQQAVHEQEPTFKEKEQTFSFKHPEAVPALPLDTKLLFIIIQNLLSNAHKYSPEGATITLTLETRTDGSYAIVCADTGYGVPKNQQDSVFKKLFRADNIRSLDVEGTGLGLYMIKTIVDAAGCRISFVSEEGKGTTFTILIPATGMKAKTGTRTLGE